MNKELPKNEQDQPKEPYIEPELVTYGDVEELTRGGRSVNPNDAQSSLDTTLHPSK